MHGAQQYFFELTRKHFPEYFEWRTVLENGGSVNINGTIRQYYTNCAYTGVDLGSGDCVDIVCDASRTAFPDKSFDVVVSSELYEHAASWKEIFQNSRRMVKDDGFMLFTCAGYNRPEHGTSRTDLGSSQLSIDAGMEYYGNLGEKEFNEAFDFKSSFDDWQFYENQENYDLYFVGIPKSSSNMGRLTPKHEHPQIIALTKDVKAWLGDKLINV